MNFQENDYAKITGLVTEIQYSHEFRGEKFHYLTVEVKRQSGTLDNLKVLASEWLIANVVMNSRVTVVGEMRSYNTSWADGSNRTLIVLFAKDVQHGYTEDDENECYLEGRICKKPTFRVTPFGREVSDVCLAINLAYGKSAYLPCIVWGRNARFVSTLEVGKSIRVQGRFQSRIYTKLINEVTEERTVYEVSVSKVEVKEVIE